MTQTEHAAIARLEAQINALAAEFAELKRNLQPLLALLLTHSRDELRLQTLELTAARIDGRQTALDGKLNRITWGLGGAIAVLQVVDWLLPTGLRGLLGLGG